MSRFEKRRTEGAAPRASPGQTRRGSRLALLLGTAATITCPVALADDVSETARLNEDMLVALRPPATGPARLTPRAADYLSLDEADIEPVSNALPDLPRTRLEPFTDDTRNIPAKPPAAPPSVQPYRKEEGKRRRSDSSSAKLITTFGGRTIGSVSVETSHSDILSVNGSELEQQLAPLLDDTTRLLLSQFRNGPVSLVQLRAIGIEAELNSAAMTLDLSIPSGRDATLAIYADPSDTVEAANLSIPADPAAWAPPTIRPDTSFAPSQAGNPSAAVSGFDSEPGNAAQGFDDGWSLTFENSADAGQPDAGKAPQFIAFPEKALDQQDGRRAVEGARMQSPSDGVQPVRFFTLDTVPPPPSSPVRSQPSPMEAFREKQSKVVTIELMTTYQGRSIGPMAVDTTLSEVVAVNALHLQQKLGPLLDASTQLLLSQFESGAIPVDQLRAIGVEAELDPATLTMSIEAPAKPNGPLELNLGGREAPEGTETAYPAKVAAGLTSTFLYNQDFEDADSSTLSSAFSGFVNFGGPTGLNLDYGGILTFDDGTGESRYNADRTVLFMDRPDEALRFEAGTLYSPLSNLAGEADFLGVGVTKSYRQLQPTRVLRPLGQRAFQLNRASEVTVLVDGQEISRFNAPAGPVELNDIPLANLSNRVSIVVEDEFGRRETESFSIASDTLLLQPGVSEYSFGIGQKRDQSRSGFQYEDQTIALGSFQYGLTPNLTVGAYGYASDEQSLAGTQSVFGVLDGIAQLDFSVSDSDTSGSGFASSVDYRWNSSPSEPRAQSFAVAVDYRDENYAPAGSFFGSGQKLEASAFYERQLSERVRVSLAGNYSENYFTDSPSHSVSIGSSYQLGRFFIGAGARAGTLSNGEDEVGGFLTVTRRLGRRSSLNGRYDTRNDYSSLRYRQPSTNDVGSFGFESEISRRSGDEMLRGAADYTANRYRSRLALTHAQRDGAMDNSTTMSARFQTGLAFADGKLGLGRDPGRGFVMVDRHKSLEDAQVSIRSRGRDGVRATSGLFGPAVSQVNSPFVPTTTLVDVSDAPIGYNIGEGSYYSVPGARSGISITVGADDFRSAVVTFLAYGEPVSLTAGTVTNLETGETQVTFTNRAGRALISNLVPGRYRLEFAGTKLAFEFDVEKDSDAFTNLGTVDLTEGDMP